MQSGGCRGPPPRGQEVSWKHGTIEDRRSVHGQVWGRVSQARPGLRSPEDRTSVGMAEAE